MVVCLFLQAMLFVFAIQHYIRHVDELSHSGIMKKLIFIYAIMLILVVGNLAQIAVWALLFLQIEEFSSFTKAFYHSAVNFSTLGYGDVVMSLEHKLLGPLEAMNGIIMVGLSTSLMMASIQKIAFKAKHF
jgi:hypothetical protein